MRCAVASSSELAARAGISAASAGGNAVDAALAALMVSQISEPGLISPLGGAFLTIWPPDGDPVTIDANVAMPGAGLPDEARGGGAFTIHSEYGGGIDLTIGYGTCAVPGAIAGMAEASRHFGQLPWADVLAPAVVVAKEGFALPQASDYYLDYVHFDLFGWDPASFDALHHGDGSRFTLGDTVHVDGLADTLAALAHEGADLLYRGELGATIAERVQAGGGLLTREDLATYETVTRPSRLTRVGDWSFAASPPPAIGGTTLTAMLELLARVDSPAPWGPEEMDRLVAVQDAVLGHRVEVLDHADDLAAATAALLDEVAAGAFAPHLRSPSTVHTSAVDVDGLACAVTSSAGYGAGALVEGLWLNNALGEPELNRKGYHAAPTGRRLPSNMAPSVAKRDDGRVMAIGSPGADRITTATLQTFVHHEAGLSLADAVAHPRVHVQHGADGEPVVAVEGDLEHPIDERWTTRDFHPNHMFFGGVAVAVRDADGNLDAAADPRRTGGAVTSDD